MREADELRQALEDASGLAGVLGASWDAFDLIVTGCQHGERGSRELFAAFAFAGAAAATGRRLVTAAPSLPAGHGRATSPARPVADDQEQLADTLASLARALHERLVAAYRQAGDPADQDACADAAVHAVLVRELLARGDR